MSVEYIDASQPTDDFSRLLGSLAQEHCWSAQRRRHQGPFAGLARIGTRLVINPLRTFRPVDLD